MIDILVVAHAPFTAINRRPYAELARRGWSVEMAIPRRLPFEAREAGPATPDDPPIHWVTTAGSINSRYWSFPELASLLQARRPRMVILENEPDSRIAQALARWSLAHRARLLLISNENDLPPVLPALMAGRWKPALRALRSRIMVAPSRGGIDHVFSICDDGVEAMSRLGLGGRVSKVPLGFDPAVFHPDAEARSEVRAQLGVTEPVVAYIGRMTPIKGVHLLLDALDQLGDRSWRFLIDDAFQGPGDYARKIRARIEASDVLRKRTLSFAANHVEVARYMNAADIVVAPSIWKEQYGRVAPEAMACGKAVIVSDAGALPELVGDAGVVTPMGDVVALAAAIGELLDHPAKREELGAAAAQRALAELSLPRQIDCMDAVLRRLSTAEGPA